MMDYSELTDFQINKLVASKFLPCDYIFNEKDGRVDLAAMQDVMVHGMHDQLLKPYAEFNPCNDPSDAWPIILENRIEIHPRDIRVSRNEFIKGWGAVPESCAESYEIFSKGKNPLRCAMIVYLMMGDDDA